MFSVIIFLQSNEHILTVDIIIQVCILINKPNKNSKDYIWLKFVFHIYNHSFRNNWLAKLLLFLTSY